MNEVTEKLALELDRINKMIHKLRTRQTKLSDYSDGTVIAKPYRDHYQYFFKTKKESEVYIPMGEVEKYRPYAQYKYEERTLRNLLQRKAIIERFLSKYDTEGMNAIYNRLSEGKRRIVVPVERTDETLIEDWLSQNPGGQNPFPIETDLYTDKGEHIRSKSEKIIADQLKKNNIPYQYEPELDWGEHRIYPDFAAYNVRDRRTVYWEHFGILSSEDYASKNYSRIQEYEKNGLILGKDLIITMESPEMPLDVKLIQKKIELFL